MSKMLTCPHSRPIAVRHTYPTCSFAKSCKLLVGMFKHIGTINPPFYFVMFRPLALLSFWLLW